MIHAPPNPLKVGSDNFRVLHGLQSREHHFPILIPMPVPSKGAPFLGLPSPDVLSEYVPDRLRVPPRLKESSTPVTVGNCQKLCGKTLIAPERRFFPWEKSALGQPIGKHTQKTGSKFTLGLAVGGIEFLIEPRIAQKVRENNMQFSSEANCGFEPQCVNQFGLTPRFGPSRLGVVTGFGVCSLEHRPPGFDIRARSGVGRGCSPFSSHRSRPGRGRGCRSCSGSNTRRECES